MQVYCRKTSGNAELQCCVCGQGFVLFWDRHTATERAVIKAEMMEILRRQHRSTNGPEAHPMSEFSVPEGQSPFPNETVMVTGTVPIWDL